MLFVVVAFVFFFFLYVYDDAPRLVLLLLLLFPYGFCWCFRNKVYTLRRFIITALAHTRRNRNEIESPLPIDRFDFSALGGPLFIIYFIYFRKYFLIQHLMKFSHQSLIPFYFCFNFISLNFQLLWIFVSNLFHMALSHRIGEPH